MDKLKGPEALNVIIKKFSDSCGVVKCVVDFFKSVANAEETYASNLSKLTKSGIPFRSTLFMRLFDLEPHQELQSLKKGWETLGNQLHTLAEHHREKASSYLAKVRQPLLEILPKLEERKKKLGLECAELNRQLEAAKKKHAANRKKYCDMGDRLQKMDGDLDKAKSSGNAKSKLQLEPKVLLLSSEVQIQEERYRQSVRELHQMHSLFDQSVLRICTDIQKEEVNRIKAISDSMKQFTKILSNTCPMYLSGMQYITLSLEEISAEMDLQGFADKHKELMAQAHLPEFEMHPFRARLSPPSGTKKTTPKQLSSWNKSDNKKVGEQEEQQQQEETEAKGNNRQETKEVNNLEESKSTRMEDSAVLTPNEDENIPVSMKSEADRTENQPPISSERQGTTGSPNELKPDPVVCEVEVHPPPSSSESATPEQTSDEPVDTAAKVTTQEASEEQQTSSRISKSPSDDDDASSTKTDSINVATPPLVVAFNYDSSLPAHDMDTTMVQLLSQLTRFAEENDYYGLLGATAASSASDLAQCRRDRNQELHPDHFVNEPDKQKIAEDKLSEINLVYTNVLKQEASRSLYNQLCKFRKGYAKFPTKGEADLKVAKDKLSQLQKSLKRSGGSTNSLLREIDCALALVNRKLSLLQDR